MNCPGCNHPWTYEMGFQGKCPNCGKTYEVKPETEQSPIDAAWSEIVRTIVKYVSPEHHDQMMAPIECCKENGIYPSDVPVFVDRLGDRIKIDVNAMRDPPAPATAPAECPDDSRADWRPFTFRKVRTHIKALTYAPKIPAVLSGKVRQTIRPQGNVGNNDIILFHGWQGKPYRSPWSWRLKVQLSMIYNIEVFKEGIIHGDTGKLIKWRSRAMDATAKSDGIIPEGQESPGEAMGNLFNKMYVLPSFGHDKAGKWFTVLIWDWPPLERKFSNEIRLKAACDAALTGKPKITGVLDESKLVRKGDSP